MITIPKIENWSKTYEGLGGAGWKNDNTGKTVSVEQKRGKWIVNINGSRKKTADTKNEAKDWAVEWMRDHPMANKKGTKSRRHRANLGR